MDFSLTDDQRLIRDTIRQFMEAEVRPSIRARDKEEKFAGDELHWQGQNAGRSDQMIIEHKARGLELLVFYRVDADKPFRYEGIFEHIDHSGARPTNFKLRRVQT